MDGAACPGRGPLTGRRPPPDNVRLWGDERGRRSMVGRVNRGRIVKGVAAVGVALLFGATPAFGSTPTYNVGPIANVSVSCAGQNAEVEQAVDSKLGYVYETWMGCRGIAFARSTDGGSTFGAPISVPGSGGSNGDGWDPAGPRPPGGARHPGLQNAEAGPGESGGG